jgi:hypothetical protein
MKHLRACCNSWLLAASAALVSSADSDHEFEASVLSDSLLDRKPRKRALNLALGLDELYRGGTKRLKVIPA